MSFGYRGEGVDVSQTDHEFTRAAARGLRKADRLVMEGILDEVAGMVWRDDITVVRPVEGRDLEEIMIPRTTQWRAEDVAGAGANVVVVETELDSPANKDRDFNLISNSDIVLPLSFDEETDSFPI
ncbi:hypothetical protein V6N12_024441 [Hibiscus sabdariffa]|uniref:Uncharacterized protein n=1 Tax=Hibiscus sabdariffa TaxID=183260 RepID=A0ABR2G0S7_9ROSI